MSGTEEVQEEDMKRKRDKGITEEMEALGDMEAYAGSVASSNDRDIEPDQFLKQISNISSAISVHRNKSGNYIIQL
ncbi:MAG: hypothetical protein ACRD8W_22255 [Nitrososphaeraceae archaeon]